jgi:phosphoserine phosphatase RsbU/P
MSLTFTPAETSSPIAPSVRRVALGAGAALLYVLGMVYHLFAWQAGSMPGTGATALYNVIVLSGYACWFLFLLDVVTHRRLKPARTFGLALMAGVLFIVIARVASPEAGVTSLDDTSTMDLMGFDSTTGVPMTFMTVLRVNLLSLLEATFAFLLLIWLRELVLYKRTRTSQRNWTIMLGLMAAAGLTAFMHPPRTETGLLQDLAMVPAIGFMVANAFRVSWIVSLTVREKAVCIALCLGLLIMLVAGIALGDNSILPGVAAYVRYYSYPLAVFANLAIIFGILYCTTALLSMLFHLPTTEEFRRVDTLRAKAGEVATMNALPQFVSDVFDRARLFENIASSAVEAGAAHGTWLAVADVSTGSLRPRIRAIHGVSEEMVEKDVDYAALYAELFESRAPILLDHARADRRVRSTAGSEIGSMLVLPLIARQEMIGALFCTREVSFGFEQDDVEALQVFAAQAAMSLDNARLFEERIEKERLARELDIAREVQQRLLPQRLPRMAGVELAAASVAAQEVGGDYYDVLRLDEHRVALIVADVAGKGASAAFYMAEMQGIFRSLARMTSSPREFMVHANEVLLGSIDKQAFISAIYAILDTKAETLSIARAGHCPVAMIDLRGEARLLRTRGMGLALAPTDLFDSSLAEEIVELQPGDVFVFYTDGVVESRDASSEEFGYERLLKALAHHRHEEADDLHRHLIADLDGFVGTTSYDDDMTLVVLKWHGIKPEISDPAERPIRQHHHS